MSEIDYKTVLEALLPHGSLWRPAKTYETSGTGEELVTNGTFDTGISGWIDASVGVGVVQWDAGGYMHLLNPDPGPSDYAKADQQIAPTAPGAQYQLTFDIIAGSVLGGTVEVGAAQGDTSLLSIPITATGSYSQTFNATGPVTWIGIKFTPNSDVGMKIDNVSIVALTSTVTVGKGLWQLIMGMADNHEIALEFLRDLTYIRDPRRTPILDDLEREFGIYPNRALTESVRRSKLAAVKYARVGTGSKDNLERALHTAGFDELFVWENSPAQDPNIFWGGAQMYCQESPPLLVASATTGSNDRAMTSPDGITWTIQSTPNPDNDWQSITWGNGLYVCVAVTGTGTRVMTSPDGVNWAIRTSAADNDWRSVTWGHDGTQGLFVAVASSGTNNRVMTSPDGINWTSQDTTGKDREWRSVAYGNGLFVAVATTGTGDRVMTSPDGVTWTLRSSAVDNLWRSIAFGNDIFVAVSSDGTNDRVMTSPDGITWTTRVNSVNNAWQEVCFGAGLFVAVSTNGTNDQVMTSPDGITWTTRTTPSPTRAWQGAAYKDDIFVATAHSGTGDRVMSSPDGITWTNRTSAADNNWTHVVGGIVPYAPAQCGEPDAQCAWFQGELIVNGDIFEFTVDYTVLCGETLAQCGEPAAVSGELTGVTRTKIEYPIPTDPTDWPLVFFVGGDATFNPDTGASIYCGETLAQCGEPLAFAEWFNGELQDIEFVTLPYSRRADLVRLILQIKPIHSWCGLLVNYT